MEWTMGIILLCVAYDLINLHLSEREYGKIRNRLVSSELAHSRNVGCSCGNVSKVHSGLSKTDSETRKDSSVHAVKTHDTSPRSKRN